MSCEAVPCTYTADVSESCLLTVGFLFTRCTTEHHDKKLDSCVLGVYTVSWHARAHVPAWGHCLPHIKCGATRIYRNHSELTLQRETRHTSFDAPHKGMTHRDRVKYCQIYICITTNLTCPNPGGAPKIRSKIAFCTICIWQYTGYVLLYNFLNPGAVRPVLWCQGHLSAGTP